MRRAYLGPKLEELASGALPDAFEADERATPECPDLLQLVSGRQLLGAVRERRLELLARQAAAAAALREGRQPAAAAALPAGSRAAVGEERQGSKQQQQQCEQSDRQTGKLSETEAHSSEPAQCEMQPPRQLEEQAQREQQQQAQARQHQREPDILDLFVGDELVASAVRHFPRQQQQQKADQVGTGSGSDAGSWTAAGSSRSDRSGRASEVGSGAAGAASQQPDAGAGGPGSVEDCLPAEVIGIYDRAGQLLAQVGTVAAGGRVWSAMPVQAASHASSAVRPCALNFIVPDISYCLADVPLHPVHVGPPTVV